MGDGLGEGMFGGICRVEKEMKYLWVMGEVYGKGREKGYKGLWEVKGEIMGVEGMMRKNVQDGSGEKGGMRGSEMIGKSGKNYVKYDGGQMQNWGLESFGMLGSGEVYEVMQ